MSSTLSHEAAKLSLLSNQLARWHQSQFKISYITAAKIGRHCLLDSKNTYARLWEALGVSTAFPSAAWVQIWYFIIMGWQIYQLTRLVRTDNRFQHMGPTDELHLFNKINKPGLDHTEDLAVLLGSVLQYFSVYLITTTYTLIRRNTTMLWHFILPKKFNWGAEYGLHLIECPNRVLPSY